VLIHKLSTAIQLLLGDWEFSIPFVRVAGHNERIRVTEQTHNQYRWQLADNFAPQLEELLRTQPIEVVKDDRAKFVARYELHGRAFYVKRYRHGAYALRPMKFFFKRSQAAEEWWLAGELQKCGVPIVRHVALGERWTVRGLVESVLITEAFDGVPVEQQHEKFFPQIIGLIESMAKASVVHEDFHPANLLLHEATGEIRLIDLYGARIAAGKPMEQIRESLLAQLGVTLPSLPMNGMVARRARDLRKQKLAERARRCLKTNRDFARRRFSKFTWQLRRAELTPEVEAVLRDPDGFLTRARVLKAGRSSTVGADGGYVLKRNNFKKPFNLVKDLIRGTRGRRDFLKGYHLELCGISTAKILATADERILGLPTRSFVLMEEIPGAVDAGQGGGPVVSLFKLVARLHEEGFIHRDLKETNLIFDGQKVPHLIDLDGLRFVSKVTDEQAGENLRRLMEGLLAAGQIPADKKMNFALSYTRARSLSKTTRERAILIHAHVIPHPNTETRINPGNAGNR
jgi:tRNA A-37 threonylcarbamoyl transferase component Bud32